MITDCLIEKERRIKLKTFTPSESEWIKLKSIADKLSIKLSISPEKGYRYAPAINFDNVQGYVQKHISGWKLKENISFNDGKVMLEKGVICQLQKGMFNCIKNDTLYDFKVEREDTNKYLKPTYELYCVIDNRKISLSQIENIIDKHPEMISLIKESFFNNEFYSNQK